MPPWSSDTARWCPAFVGVSWAILPIPATRSREQYCHRTGHNIGQEAHGNGAHMDGLEAREDRRVIRRTCFSIEPGTYLPDFGARSEVDIYIDKDGAVHVTGGEPQTEVHKIVV